MREDNERKSIAKRPTDTRVQTGKTGEKLAEQFLLERGYEIVERNWRCRSGEIDLIAHDGGKLVFIEVRTRSGANRFGTAVESVTPRKQIQVRRIAEIYLKIHGSLHSKVRFDVVAVTLPTPIASSAPQIEHYINAF